MEVDKEIQEKITEMIGAQETIHESASAIETRNLRRNALEITEEVTEKRELPVEKQPYRLLSEFKKTTFKTHHHVHRKMVISGLPWHVGGDGQSERCLLQFQIGTEETGTAFSVEFETPRFRPKGEIDTKIISIEMSQHRDSEFTFPEDGKGKTEGETRMVRYDSSNPTTLQGRAVLRSNFRFARKALGLKTE